MTRGSPLKTFFCIVAIALPGCSSPQIHAPADVMVPCTALLSNARYELLQAESHKPTSLANMEQRWADLSDLINLPDPEVKDISVNPTGRWGFLANCTRPAIDRFTIYYEWHDVLAEEASTALIAEDRTCPQWTDAIARYKIATHAAEVAQLVSRFGNRDRDIVHVEGLVSRWAAARGMRLPPFTSLNAVLQLQSDYGRKYDRALASASRHCQ